MQAIALAALAAQSAKQRAKEAHEKFVAASIKFGGCTAASDEEEEICFSPCYNTGREKGGWCEACTARQPYHAKKIEASRASGVALRRLWRLCRIANTGR